MSHLQFHLLAHTDAMKRLTEAVEALMRATEGKGAAERRAVVAALNDATRTLAKVSGVPLGEGVRDLLAEQAARDWTRGGWSRFAVPNVPTLEFIAPYSQTSDSREAAMLAGDDRPIYMRLGE